MRISVSVALFRDWPHAYSSGQSSLVQLGCSFSTAVSCFLLGLISVSGIYIFFYFLLSSLFFFPRIGCNRRTGTMSQLVCGKPFLKGLGQPTYKNLVEYFLPTISSTSLDQSSSGTQSWTAALSSQCCCTWKDGAPDVSCFLFQLFSHAIKHF